MTNRTTLAQLREMDVKQAASLPTDHIAMLLEDVAAQKAGTKHLEGILHDVLRLRFGAQADAVRKAKGKDTGTVSLDEGEFIIRADLPKTVSWDQAALQQAADVVESWSEDPKDYIVVKLAVSETKYNAWPTTIRKVFEPARTVGTGKPTFKIERRAA